MGGVKGDDMGVCEEKSERPLRHCQGREVGVCERRGVRGARDGARHAINKGETISNVVPEALEREKHRSLLHEICSRSPGAPKFTTAVRRQSYQSIIIYRRRSKHCMAPQIKLLARVVLEYGPYHAAPWLRQREFASQTRYLWHIPGRCQRPIRAVCHPVVRPR